MPNAQNKLAASYEHVILKPMRILFVSSEVYPYSKTGGLGDVAGALPEALVREGHEVLVVSPWYKTHKGQKPLWIGDVMVPFDDGDMSVGVGELTKNSVRYAFVGHSDFNRDSLYGFEDDGKRFARFTRAVPQVAERVNFYPEVVHANDWHTGYLPMLLRVRLATAPRFCPFGNGLHPAQCTISRALELRRPLKLAPPPLLAPRQLDELLWWCQRHAGRGRFCKSRHDRQPHLCR